MTTTDWIIDIALVLIVFRQLREERLTARTILLPLALMSWAGFTYLHSVPTAGNDLLLIGLLTALGVVFGVFGGLLTRVRYNSDSVYIKATVSAAALWVISMGFRMAFAVWSSYGSGISHIASFSAAHDITSGQAWVTALIFMAFGEVIVRLGTIMVRGQLLTVRDGQGGTRHPASMAQARS
jgi:membrane protein CcdC involved in cytochrome C biogenesis